VATGLGPADAILIAGSAQIVAAALGVALARLPARTLRQASAGG
jgi:hypothetical protein